MDKLPEVKPLLAVLNKKKHLMNPTENSLLWDLYKFLANGKPELSEKKLELCLDTWNKVLGREESGEQPLSELADLKFRVKELEETVEMMVEAYHELVKQLPK